MTIKVLHMLDSLNRGGAEMLELDVCRNARSAGLDLTFVATGGGDLEADFADSGVEYIRLQRKWPVDLPLVRQLRRIINERGIQIAHAQQAVEALHLYLATLGTGVKCVMSLQNYILDNKNRIATRFILPRMDAVCPVSESMLEWFRDAEGFAITAKFHVLHNGVDEKRLAPTRAIGMRTLREELGFEANHQLLGMVGNFYRDERKDQWTVCRALPKIFQRFPAAHFVFVGAVHIGADEYHSRCVNFCRDSGLSDRVHFVGTRGDIPDLLRELDLFVFSSVQEGLPVAAIEALFLGVPMIVSDIPPLLEVAGEKLAEGPCTAIFRTGNADDLAEKLTDLLSDPARMIELGEKARRQMRKRFSIEVHLHKLRELYEHLTTDNRQPTTDNRPLRILVGMPDKDSLGGPIYCEPPYVRGLLVAGVEADEEVYVYGEGAGLTPVWRRIFRVLEAARRLRRRTRENRYDVIHLNTSIDEKCVLRDLVTLVFLRSSRVPVYLKMHGSIAAFLETKSYFWRRLQRRLFAKAAGIGILSSEERENFLRAGCPAEKLFDAKYVVEPDAFKPDPGFRERHGIARSTPILLFSARFIPAKGLLTVIEACAELKRRGRDFVLFCLGDGPVRGLAEKLSADLGLTEHICFTGYISENETAVYHANSTIFAFPTYHDEGFPLVLLKSLAAGLPIVTTRVRAAADYLKEPENCLWVTPRDPHELAAKIIRLLDDHQLRAAMSENNRRLAEQFTAENVVREYIKVYETFIARAPKSG